MEVTDVRGVGPATAIKLKSAGIDTAEDLAKKSVEDLGEAGIRAGTATKIIQAAVELVAGEDKKEPSVKKPAKKAKKAPKKVEKTEEVKTEAPVIKGLAINQVKGIGPKTKTVLEESGIVTAELLSESSVDNLINLGIGKATARKIINNAAESLGIEAKIEDAPAGEVKPKPAKRAKAPTAPSPMPQGIPTRKKRGTQISSIADEQEATPEAVEKPEGWGVQAREVSAEELEKRKRRQEEIARRRTITREIPSPPQPVTAIKSKKTKETKEKPLKLEKSAKKKRKVKAKVAKTVEYYSPVEIYQRTQDARRRGVKGKSSEASPRIVLDRDTYLGKITSHRRSRRVIHDKQVIVELADAFNPDQLVGQKVYFVYPDNERRVAGSIGKRFGKVSSKKVLVYFKKGIRMEGMSQKIFIK